MAGKAGEDCVKVLWGSVVRMPWTIMGLPNRGGVARTSRFGCSNKTTLCLPTWRNLRYYCGLIDRSCFQGMVNLQMNMFQ